MLTWHGLKVEISATISRPPPESGGPEPITTKGLEGLYEQQTSTGGFRDRVRAPRRRAGNELRRREPARREDRGETGRRHGEGQGLLPHGPHAGGVAGRHRGGQAVSRRGPVHPEGGRWRRQGPADRAAQ